MKKTIFKATGLLVTIVQLGFHLGLQLSHAKEVTAPTAFTANCQACHIVDQAVVGPSLVEIAELYPPAKQAEFIQWCIDPGKKRPTMPQMPSMAHIAEAELIKIQNYILKVTVGVKRIKPGGVDIYANTPIHTVRPRIDRLFVSKSSPISLILALDTEEKHNIIWDADQCRLRYISIGKISVSSTRMGFAKVGKVIYTETALLNSDSKPQFKGYSLDENGVTTFIYSLNDMEIKETIEVKEQKIIRTIKADSALPKYELTYHDSKDIKVSINENQETLTITYQAL